MVNKIAELREHLPKDDLRERVASLTGLDTEPLDDTHRYAYDKESGVTLVEIRKYPNIEEDIAYLQGAELQLNKEEYKTIVNTALTDMFKLLGEHFDPVLVEYMFPGIDIYRIEDYDFSTTRIRFYPLTEEAFTRFDKNLYPQDPDYYESAAAFCITDRVFDDDEIPDKDYRKIIVTLMEYPLVVLNEKPITKGFTKEDLQTKLRIAIMHEVLHIMKCCDGNTSKLLHENITHWYALHMALAKETDDIARKQMKKYGNDGTEGIAIMMLSLIEENAIDLETLDQAFIRNDVEAQTSFYAALCKVYNNQVAKQILEDNFRHAEGFTTTEAQRRNFLRFIIEQERKKGGVHEERMRVMFAHNRDLYELT